MTAGWIYVLDPNMTVNGRTVVKVGFTTRTVEQRARELGTGIPGGMSIAYKLRVDNARAVERRIHGMLRHARVSSGPGREFFALTAEEAIATIEKIALQISSERVREAFEKELFEFRRDMGINRREGWVFAASAAFFIGCCATLVMLPGWKFNIGSAVVVAIALYLAGRGTKAVYSFLHDRLVDRPYGDQLRAKVKELKLKYPTPTIQGTKVNAA